MLKDVLQWALIVVFAGLSVFLYSQRHEGGQPPVAQPTPSGGRDGNPIGFDLKTTDLAALDVTGNAGSNTCFLSGSAQAKCYVQIRFLSVQNPPRCWPGATYDCQNNETSRKLPPCPPDAGTLCFTVTATAFAQDQDIDGVHLPIGNQLTASPDQARIIVSPNLIPNK